MSVPEKIHVCKRNSPLGLPMKAPLQAVILVLMKPVIALVPTSINNRTVNCYLLLND